MTTPVDLLEKRSCKGSETVARTPMAGNDRQRSCSARTIELKRQEDENYEKSKCSGILPYLTLLEICLGKLV